MRIGSVTAPRTATVQPTRVQARPEDFGAGIATALGGLSSALMSRGETQIDIINAEREREERTRRAGLDLEMIRLTGETQRRVIDERVNVQPGASGYTNSTYESLGATFEDFASRTGLTDEERALYAPRWEQFVQTQTTQAFTFEVEESNRALVDQFSTTVDAVRGEVLNNPFAFEERWIELETAINQSDLPPTVREELLQNSYNSIASVLYQSVTEEALETSSLVEGRPLSQGEIDTAAPLPRTALPISGNMSSNPRVYNAVSTAWAQVMPPGSRIEVSSAARPDGRPTSQHYHGNAIDFAVYRPDGTRVMWNDPEALQAAQVGRTLGVGGFGWGPTYMSGQTFHWDLREGFSTWSDDDGGASDAGPGARQFHEMLAGIQPGDSADLSVVAQQRPDIWTDPRFESIPFEQRLQLEQNAEAAVIARQQEARRQAEAQEASLMMQIRTLAEFGNTDQAYQMGLDALSSGQISGVENMTRIAGYGDTQREQQALVGIQTQRREAGAPAIPSDMPGLEAEAVRLGTISGLQSMEPNAGAAVLANAQRDGMIATNVMDTLFAQLNSGNAQQQIYSAELLADLYAANPRAATSGLSREQIADVALANTLARVSATPAEFTDRLTQMRAPENAQMRQQQMELADEMLEEQGLPNFYRQMYGNMERWFGGASMPGVGQLPQFENDARTLYREFFALTGDQNAAQQATADVLRHVYTPSPFGGELMQYSPTAPMMNVPTVAGSHEWITQHVQDFAQSEINLLVDREVQAAVAAGMPEEEAREVVEADYGSRFDVTDMRVIADTQTLMDLQQHGVPSYQVVYTDQYGMLRLLRDADNNVMRVPMTPSEDTLRAEQIGAAIIHAESLVDRVRFGPAMQAVGTGAAVVGAMLNPTQTVANALRNNMPSPQGDVAEAESVAAERLYQDIQQYSDNVLVRLRDNILAGANNPDPFGGQSPAGQMAEPTPAERRLILQINRILQERANQ